MEDRKVYYRPNAFFGNNHINPGDLDDPRKWTELFEIRPSDRLFMEDSGPIGFTADNKYMYWHWADGNYRYNKSIQREFDTNTWLVTYESSSKPYEFFIYRRKYKAIEFKLHQKPGLKNMTLPTMVDFKLNARDGKTIFAYLTLPVGTKLKDPNKITASNSHKIFAKKGILPEKPMPLVLYVHGGPYSRDSIGFDPMLGFLTSRGMAVLQVNYRGSSGFGWNFMAAGYGQWGTKMQEDLEDAVICGSYGGYAALFGLVKTPEKYACGIDISGPSNLTLMREEWHKHQDKSWYHDFKTITGYTIENDTDLQELHDRSPVNWAQNITKPLLIVHGDKDDKVDKAHADQMAEELRKARTPFKYISFANEGHGISNSQVNVLNYAAEVEHFLHICIGTPYDAFEKDYYPKKGSTIKVEYDSLPKPKTRADHKPVYHLSEEELDKLIEMDKHRRHFKKNYDDIHPFKDDPMKHF